MPGSNLDQLTREEKRALLAERLRNQSRLTPSAATLSRGEGSAPQDSNEGRRSFLDGEVIALASPLRFRSLPAAIRVTVP